MSSKIKTPPAKVAKKKAVKETYPKYVRHINSARSITITYESAAGKQKSETLPSTHSLFAEAKAHLADGGKKEDLVKFIVTGRTERLSGGRVKKENGVYMIGGKSVPEKLRQVLEARIAAGHDTRPFENFFEKLMKNPSERSREQFFDFCIRRNITLLEDGRCVFYKGVNSSSLLSFHDNRTKHKVGEYTRMERKKVVDEVSQCAAGGLHCAPWDYVKQHYSGGDILELYVDPEHIVSVPHDAYTKLRCCEYYVNAVVNKDGKGVRSGLYAVIGEQPAGKDAKHGKDTQTAAAPVAKQEVKARKDHAKKEAKAGIKTQAPAAGKTSARLEVAGGFLVLPSSLLSACGFSPREEVFIRSGARKLYVDKSRSNDAASATVLVSGALKIRQSVLVGAGCAGKRFRAAMESRGQVNIEPC